MPTGLREYARARTRISVNFLTSIINKKASPAHCPIGTYDLPMHALVASYSVLAL